MSQIRSERQVITLYFLTDLWVFWLALSMTAVARLDTLYQVDVLVIERDRLLCLMIFVGAALLGGCYRATRITDRFDSVYYVILAVGAATILELAIVTLVPKEARDISRREILLGSASAVILLAGWHFVAARLVARIRNLHGFFYVIGEEKHGQRIAEEIRRDRSIQADARFVTFEILVEKIRRRDAKLGSDRPPSEDVIIASAGTLQDRLHEILAFCEVHSRRTFLYPSLWDTLLFKHYHMFPVAGLPLIEVTTGLDSPYRYVKRIMDISAALAMLLASLPICLATAIAIKMTSPGPVFYTQERMGRHGKVFKLYKFRSMIADAEAKTGPVWAAANDTRVTPIGRFIRKHRIDELPQLLSILKGNMSLIGPRPERPHFHQEFCRTLPLFDRRLVVRPGLTSLSHVMGSYSSEPADRLRYDLVYIGNMSFLMDMRILFATVRVVLGAKGAQ